MRVAVFGAAGQLGRRVVSRLVEQGRCSAVLAADRDARGLQDLHSRFEPRGVAVRYLDAGDPRSAAERASGMDAVISCLGGSGSDELGSAVAALGGGALFLSSSEDPGFRHRLREAAARLADGRGTAVVGLGWSPGLSNLLAVRAAAGFERLDSLDISWAAAAPDLRSPGGQESVLRRFRGRCASFEQGRLKEVRAGSWEEWVSFPPEVGWTGVAYSCQPEPLTLPGRLPGALRVRVKGGLLLSAPPHSIHTLAWLSARLPEHLQELVNQGTGLALKRLHRPDGEARLSGLRVEAAGIKGGRRAVAVLGATGGYLDATAGMLAAALGLARGEAGRGRGVLAPEEAFGLGDLLPALRREGIRFWGVEDGGRRGVHGLTRVI